MTSKYRGLLPQLKSLAVAAGLEILSIYDTDFAVQFKSDRSPVTEADLRADNLIQEGLRACAPEIYVISEERFSQQRDSIAITNALFFLVDPLDGTRGFIQRNGEFTVNIALIEHTKPVLGVVHLPICGTTYWADEAVYRVRSGEIMPESIQCRQPLPEGLTSISSRDHPDDRTRSYLEQFHIARTIISGSSLKLCKIAEGSADLYPRFGRTMEWDTAAGHAILNVAGGTICTLDSNTLSYGKPGFSNPDFVAKGF